VTDKPIDKERNSEGLPNESQFCLSKFSTVSSTINIDRFTNTKLSAALKLIFAQWPDSKDGVTILFYRKFERMVIDATAEKESIDYPYKDAALKYLRRENILACEDCGIDSDWVRKELRWAGVDV